MPGVKLRVEIIQGIQAEAARVIGPEGGTISVNQINSPIFGVKIEIPEGVLETNTLVQIAVPSEPYDIPDNLEAACSAVDFIPDGLLFQGQYT